VSGGLALGHAAVSGERRADPAAPEQLTLRIDTRSVHQTMEHFGAADAWSMDPIGRQWDEANRERLADLLFSTESGIGLSCWRFNVGAGGALTDQLWDPWRGAECFRASLDAPYDWSKQSGQQWFLRAARDRGVEHFVAVAYSPPTWLTKNGHAHCDASVGSTNLPEGAEPKFAQFLVDVVAHFREDGIPFRCLCPANEPNWEWNAGQEGCRYANSDLIRVVRALRDELDRRAMAEVEVDVTEAGDIVCLLDDDVFREWAHAEGTTRTYDSGCNRLGLGKYREHIRAFLEDADLRRAVGAKVTAHSYWTDAGDRNLTELRRLLRRNLDRYSPGARYWMTEYCVMEHKRDLGMDTALRVARVIHHDLVDAGASAWHWWLAVSPGDYKDGLIYTDFRSDGSQSILPSKTLWALGNYSRFVRPGARHIEATWVGGTPPGDLLASAYQAEDGRAVAVLVNAGEDAVNLRIAVDDVLVGARAFVTTAERDLELSEASPAGQPVTIPPRAVVTLLADR
jgi:O-glycosyl hydrolase